MSATTRPSSAFCSRCRRKSSVRLPRTSRTWSTRISCRSRGKRQAGVGACRGCGSFLSLRTERCRSTAGLSVCPQVPACGRRVVAWRVRDAVTVVSRLAACDESFGSARRHVRPPRLASRALAEWLPFVGHLATTRVPRFAPGFGGVSARPLGAIPAPTSLPLRCGPRPVAAPSRRQRAHLWMRLVLEVHRVVAQRPQRFAVLHPIRTPACSRWMSSIEQTRYPWTCTPRRRASS